MTTGAATLNLESVPDARAQLEAIERIQAPAGAAIRAIDAVMQSGSACAFPWSSGKDSSAVVGMGLATAVLRKNAGLAVPRLLVIHSDTGVENPEVRVLADNEMRKMAAFARANGLDLEVRVGKPSLYVSWPVRVIGGRALPSFPTSNRDCSVNWKVDVGNRLVNEVFADVRARPGEPQPVVMTGVRLDESAARAAGIAERGESATEIWLDAKGRRNLSPIIHWSSDDVFEFLGYAAAGVIKTYSDFAETMQFYRDAGGSSCAVIGDLKMAESVARQKGGCGARSGCWSCVRVQKDTSLETMIESDDERYGYMRGLNRLRNYIANTQYDWSQRTYLGRSIDAHGNVEIQADVYSPAMLERLLRYTLTVQAREQIAASKLGIAPRFSIIGYRELVAIDCLWSLYGLHHPFHAIKVFNEVRAGAFLDAPITSAVPRTPTPRFGKLQVGRAWEDDRRSGDPSRDRMLAGGIRSPAHEMFSESCGFELKALNNGEVTTAWQSAEAFDVDEEGAGDFVECMGNEYVERYHHDGADRVQALSTYLGMGIVTPAHASIGRWHAIAQRTQWMQRQGLVGDLQLDRLLQMLEAQRQSQAVAPEPEISIDDDVVEDEESFDSPRIVFS
ncbi:MAG: hypothetical protein EPN79_11085 [Burkholderiaceae bacterium]|nr:MAG: hypothetical protein EPN79_11085 [Burkholderiaceae bacterium]TBR76772.1 MAG: hypothetical protein EPN64_05990 [Burkholderiaceae bacterium]